MHIHVTRFMWQNRLLRAHYVDKKWAVWGLLWANFAVVGAMKFPFCVVSARYGPEMRYRVFQGVCWGCSDFFCFAGPPSRAFRTFLLQAGGFYVGLRGCFQERLLCVFTWVTLSPSANTGRHVRPKTGFNKAVFYTGLGLMCAARIKI